jgi:CheY-like chemotaxis protein
VDSEPRQPGRVRILLADDSCSDSFLIKRGLAAFQKHCDITCVRDGDTLLRHLGLSSTHAPRHRPELILIDLYLPKLYGLQALHMIKREPHLAHTPCVMISSLATNVDRREAVRLGAAAFIEKPSSAREFRASLQAIEKILLTQGISCEPSPVATARPR